MAKNEGMIKFSGKLGDITGRMTPQGNILQRNGGFDGQRIKTEDRYLKTRQLYEEFGRCAKMASLFKSTLDFYLKLLPDPYVYNHIQKRMAAIKQCDDAPNGSKTVGKGLLTEKGMDLFKKFSFNRELNFDFTGLPFHELDLAQGSLSLKNVDLSLFTFPRGALQLGMQLLLLRVDFETPDSILEKSDFVFLEKGTFTETLILKSDIPQGSGKLVAVLFIGFCTVINGQVIWKRNKKNVLEVIGFE